MKWMTVTRLMVTAAIVSLIALCITLTNLLHREKEKTAFLNDVIIENYDTLEASHKPLWTIVAGFGIEGHDVEVRIGTNAFMAFYSPLEWPSYSPIGLPEIAVIPASTFDEHVVVTIDGKTNLDQMLNITNGQFLVVGTQPNGSAHQRRGFFE